MIYFTSDPHLGHRFVLTNRPQFSSVEEMNEILINNINQTVTPKDTLYIIGDATNRLKQDEASDLLRRIRCNKILIRGNHDKEYGPGIFTETHDYLELTYNKHTYILCHYPFICWKRMKHGFINLHGHIHSSPEYNEEHHAIGRLQYDVGVDANGYKPVSIAEIEAWADSSPWREYTGLTHHQKEDADNEEN